MFYHIHKLSSELSHSDIFNILNVCCLAFNQPFDYQYFKLKFLDNPFGDSIHVLSYDSSRNLVASRALWKLDSDVYYQCVDTAVHPHYQGRGLFRSSTEYLINSFPHLYFYNKPNSFSLPQYLKYGWKIDQIQPIGFSSRLSTSFLSSIPLIDWGQSQLQWRMSLTNNKAYSYFYHKSLYFVCAKKRRFFDMILFKTPFKLDIPLSRSLLFFSFDVKTTFHLPYSQKLLSRCPDSYVPPSFYYDMT